MHGKFYLDNKLSLINEINSIFSDGDEIKNFLSGKDVRCGYDDNCPAKLIPVILSKNKLVYLRSKRKKDHLNNCPFHNLDFLKKKLVKNKNFDFLVREFPQRSRNKSNEKTNELISGDGLGIWKLSDLFTLLKNDPDLDHFKYSHFIDPEYCDEWYKKVHTIENNLVLLTGNLSEKFRTCGSPFCNNLNGYICKSENHEPIDYKLEIWEKDIKFHISVSKEIYDSINFDKGVQKYHVLAKVNEMSMNNYSLGKKRFYTKNSKDHNDIIKNKRFIELARNQF